MLLVAVTGLVARDGLPPVLYLPSLKNIEGDQPLLASYVLSITSPSTVTPGSNLSITPRLSVVSAPAGVSNATALSFVSLSPSTLVFTARNQTLTTTVTVDVPQGTIAGDYAWAVATPGWPTGSFDGFAFINAKVTIPLVPFPPSVNISAPLDGATYNYVLSGTPLSIPLSFTATAPAVSPITSIDADINGTAITLTPSGLGTNAVAATGTIQLNQTGIFTIRARATNNAGTSSDTVEITVNVQDPGNPPPPSADCRIEWLPPISLGKVQKGGSVLPIKFRLDCHCDCGRGRKDDCDKEFDTSVVIFIHEIFANGTTSEPELFSYSRRGNCSRQDDTYAINGNHYQLNYDTARGTHRYHIDVYRTQRNSTTPQLLGTKEFTTR